MTDILRWGNALSPNRPSFRVVAKRTLDVSRSALAAVSSDGLGVARNTLAFLLAPPLGAAVVIISAFTAAWLARQTQAAWPFLDSLTTWGSLYATWLQARVKLENWLYWIAIDSLLSFLFGVQGLYFVALLSTLYLVVSVVGFLRWLKTYRTPAPAN